MEEFPSEPMADKFRRKLTENQEAPGDADDETSTDVVELPAPAAGPSKAKKRKAPGDADDETSSDVVELPAPAAGPSKKKAKRGERKDPVAATPPGRKEAASKKKKAKPGSRKGATVASTPKQKEATASVAARGRGSRRGGGVQRGGGARGRGGLRRNGQPKDSLDGVPVARSGIIHVELDGDEDTGTDQMSMGLS